MRGPVAVATSAPGDSAVGRSCRMWRAAVLLGAMLLGVTACGVLPYTGPPDTNTTELREHGRSG